MKYKYIIFDIDDTLLNFIEDKKEALIKTLNNYHVQYNNELFDTFYNICWDEWLKLGLDNSNDIQLQKNYHSLYKQYMINSFAKFREIIKSEKTPDELSEIFLNNYSNSCNLNKNAEKMCKILKSKYKLYIASNGLTKVQLSRINEITHYFDDFFISESVGNIKPSNEFFSCILNRLNIDKASECLMVGDSLECDIFGANSIGMDTCWYNAKHLENKTGINPTYEIFDFDEIIKILA